MRQARWTGFISGLALGMLAAPAGPPLLSGVTVCADNGAAPGKVRESKGRTPPDDGAGAELTASSSLGSEPCAMRGRTRADILGPMLVDLSLIAAMRGAVMGAINKFVPRMIARVVVTMAFA